MFVTFFVLFECLSLTNSLSCLYLGMQITLQVAWAKHLLRGQYMTLLSVFVIKLRRNFSLFGVTPVSHYCRLRKPYFFPSTHVSVFLITIHLWANCKWVIDQSEHVLYFSYVTISNSEKEGKRGVDLPIISCRARWPVGHIVHPNDLALHLDHTPVAQLVKHRAAIREVMSSTSAGPTLRVLK